MNDDNLSPEQIDVLRNAGTEAPFSGKLLNNTDKGVYSCAGCGSEIFKSDHKYDAGTGWPSFKSAIKNATKEKTDTSHNMIRTEVVCSTCNGHLGHVFDGVTKQSDRSFCINSLALDFDPTYQK